MPMPKSTFRVRAWASPWLVASITTLSLPAATIRPAAPAAPAPPAWCCGSRWPPAVSDADLHRADQARAPAAGPQHGRRQERGRGLAVGAGDADDVQAAATGGRTRRRPHRPGRRGGDPPPAAAPPGRAARARPPPPALRRRSPRHVVMPVDVDAGDGEEQRASLDDPGVVGQARRSRRPASRSRAPGRSRP